MVLNTGKMVVEFTLSLTEGLEYITRSGEDRIFNNRKISRPGGHELFLSNPNNLVCACCGMKGEVWLAGGNSHKDLRRTINLFGIRDNKAILFTRDHIIPKSFGGSDDVANMRVMCSNCNESRGDVMLPADFVFMAEHPELIIPERFEERVNRVLWWNRKICEAKGGLKGLEALVKVIDQLEQYPSIIAVLGDFADIRKKLAVKREKFLVEIAEYKEIVRQAELEKLNA